MTFWLDAHLSPALAVWLGSTFKVFAQSLNEIGLRDAEDAHIFEAARRFREIVIVSKDHDFVELVEQRGKPPQVLWLNVPNMSNLHMEAWLSKSFPDALKLLEAGDPLVELTSRSHP